jgi:hypothetical protein
VCPACLFINEIEPTRCPRCALVLMAGKCPICGWVPTSAPRTRAVIGTDGQPYEMTGDIFVPRRTCTAPDGPKRWERMYYRGTSAKWDATFRQMEAKYAEENGWQWPSRDWPLMPTNERDWFLRARDVPVERLRGDPELLARVRRFHEKQEAKLFVT